MLRKIHLHGELAKYGPEIELSVSTAGEAIRALAIVQPELVSQLRHGSWRIVRGDVDDGLDLEIDDLNAFQLGHADLHIVPALAGAKDGGGTLKTILGIALVGTAFALSGGTLAAPIVLGGLQTGLAWGNLAFIGAGMVLGGVSSFLAPDEKTQDSRDGSFHFTGPRTIYTQGGPVPLVYGEEVITGGVLISGGLDIEKLE